MGNVTTAGVSLPAGDSTATGAATQKNLELRAKKGARWFYWIAGLSVVNSIVMATGSNAHFVVGLGITMAFDIAGRKIGGAGLAVGLCFSFLIAGIFALFGVCASRLQKWSFLVGMILYAFDGLLLLAFQDYFGAVFHGVALYFIFLGFSAVNRQAAVARATANAPLG